MLKKYFTILLCFMVWGLSSQAQETMKKNEVSFRVGELFNCIDVDDDPVGYVHLSPIFSLEYRCHFNKVWSIGLSANYFWDKTREASYYVSNSYGIIDNCEGAAYYDYTEHAVFVLADAKARWCRHQRWNFYSRLGIGPALSTYKLDEERNTTIGYTFQVSPIGAEVGNDKIRGYLELGVGLQGFVNVGISHRF